MISLLSRFLHKFLFFFSFLLLIPFALIVFTPLKNKIKFLKIRRDVIGNSVEQLYLYLNIYKKNKFHYFFFDDDYICNNYFNKICKKNLKFSFFGKTIFYLSKKINLFNHLMLPMPSWQTINKYRFNINNLKIPNEFKFSSEENKIGNNFLNNIGVLKNQKLICLLVRDNFYKKKYSNDKKRNWNYDRYRDADINTYFKSVKYLNKKKYFVIRMGKGAKKSSKYKNKFYFDYANSNKRDDFLDFWITSRCFFFITTGTGLDEICQIYKRPVLDTNYLPYCELRSFRTNNLTIFKKIKYIKSKKILTLSDSIKNTLFAKPNLLINKYKKQFIWQNNSDHEILDAVIEMQKLLILKNKNKAKKNLFFQKKFWKIYKSFFKYDYLYAKNVNNYIKTCYEYRYLYNKINIPKNFLINNKWLQN